MAVSIEDIKKLRVMTGAGLSDCKKALTEADGDFNKAMELVRERGLAQAAKRSDRETSNGCLLVKSRSEEHTSELQSRQYLVCRLLLEKKKLTQPSSLLH